MKQKGFVAHLEGFPPFGCRVEGVGLTQAGADLAMQHNAHKFLAHAKLQQLAREVQYDLPRLGRANPVRFWP